MTDSDHARRGLLPDKAIAAEHVEAAMARFGELLLTVEDPNRPAVGKWTVGDLAAHMVVAAEVYTRIIAGAGSPMRSATVEGISETSTRLMAEIDNRDMVTLVERITVGAAALTSAAMAYDGDPTVPWHGGIGMPVSAMLGSTVGEALIHGHDIAAANRRRWTMPAPWAHTTFGALMVLGPHFFEADRAGDLRARFDVRMRGAGGPRVIFDVANRGVEIRLPEHGEKADCYISADPATLLLVLYGRTGPLVPALTGKVLAWGRKPWLGLTLPTLFRAP